MNNISRISVFLVIFFLLIFFFGSGISEASHIPSVSFSAAPSVIKKGESVALSWSSEGAMYCVSSGGWSGYKLVFGSVNIVPDKTASYTINCAGLDGSVSAEKTVAVTVLESPLIVKNFLTVANGGKTAAKTAIKTVAKSDSQVAALGAQKGKNSLLLVFFLILSALLNLALIVYMFLARNYFS